jgi:hypothetical protein
MGIGPSMKVLLLFLLLVLDAKCDLISSAAYKLACEGEKPFFLP